MPKTVEYYPNGTREWWHTSGCNSCWDCENCVNMVDPSHYMCKARGLNSHRNIKFPYDNTRCKEFKRRNDKT